VKGLLEGTAALLRWSLIAAVALMLACIALQVVMRYVFGNALSWSEELALVTFSWAALGGLALGVREGFHVRLTLLLDPLPAGARAWAERAIDLLAAALGAYLVWSGWRYVDITRGGTSAAIAYPIELLHGIAPLAGVFVLIFAVERLLLPKRQ
jgi:TRAP-type C4-dicarboxylate transport system permease small subunit